MDRTPTGQARQGIRQVAVGATIRLKNSTECPGSTVIGGEGTLFTKNLIDYHCGDSKMPMKEPPHPGETVRALCLEPMNLSITDAAKALGVSRKHFSALVNCKTGISPEMAVRLSKVFGGSARVWYMAQASYDLTRAIENADEIQLEPLWPSTEREEQAAA